MCCSRRPDCHVYLVSEFKLNTTHSLSAKEMPAAIPYCTALCSRMCGYRKANAWLVMINMIQLFKVCSEWKYLAFDPYM